MTAKLADRLHRAPAFREWLRPVTDCVLYKLIPKDLFNQNNKMNQNRCLIDSMGCGLRGQRPCLLALRYVYLQEPDTAGMEKALSNIV